MTSSASRRGKVTIRRYRVSFARIGRTHDVPPLITRAAGPKGLAYRILTYARPYLVSVNVEVAVDITTMTGSILCGLQCGGTFVIEDVTARIANGTPPAPGGTSRSLSKEP
jgi:hypothetical protein